MILLILNTIIVTVSWDKIHIDKDHRTPTSIAS